MTGGMNVYRPCDWFYPCWLATRRVLGRWLRSRNGRDRYRMEFSSSRSKLAQSQFNRVSCESYVTDRTFDFPSQGVRFAR